MKETPEYKMFFGRNGRTVDYEDASGNYTFVFDLDLDGHRPKEAKEKLLLDKEPLKDMKLWKRKTQADVDRTAVMLERVKEYVFSLGWDMELV